MPELFYELPTTPAPLVGTLVWTTPHLSSYFEEATDDTGPCQHSQPSTQKGVHLQHDHIIVLKPKTFNVTIKCISQISTF